MIVLSNSTLVNYTKLSTHKNTRTHKIDTISIHCMAGNLSVESCGNVFQSREASSNYGVGSDGRIALYVEEKNRSWCTSDPDNDDRAVTIEVANDGGAETGWHVSEKAYNALIELCTDICRRNNIEKLLWKADKSLIGQVDKQNMTVHRWFANKACPGDYLYNLHSKIASDVNAKLAPPKRTTIDAKGIYIMSATKDCITAGMVADKPDADIEYYWVATHDGGASWMLIQDWTKNNEWVNWTPPLYGDYILVCKARISGKPDSEVSTSIAVNHHPHIKAICQMPNADGCLLGMETYDNQDYSYEILIMDCSLYADGKDAWVYSTGKCKSAGNYLWTTWQPYSGYFWSLYRVYDKNNNTIDERCYGFEI